MLLETGSSRKARYAHGRTHKGRKLGIVHRDLSPQNVMVDFSGCIKLTDFGIAKATTQSHRTREGQLKGKLGELRFYFGRERRVTATAGTAGSREEASGGSAS